jgi:hypothetical protein
MIPGKKDPGFRLVETKMAAGMAGGFHAAENIFADRYLIPVFQTGKIQPALSRYLRPGCF